MPSNGRVLQAGLTAEKLKPPPLSEEEKRSVALALNEETTAASVEANDPALFLGNGQERFEKTLAIGIESNASFHNIAVRGLSGSEGFSIIKKSIRRHISGGRTRRNFHRPNDWCILHSFISSNNPIMFPLKQGMGLQLKKKMARLLAALCQKIPEAFESDFAKSIQSSHQKRFRDWCLAKENEFREQSEERGFFVGEISLPNTHLKMFIPSRLPPPKKDVALTESVPAEQESGTAHNPNAHREAAHFPEPMGNDEFAKLPKDEQAILTAARQELMDVFFSFVRDAFSESQRVENDAAKLQQDMVAHVVEGAFEELDPAALQPSSLLAKFLEGLKEYTIESFEIFLQETQKKHKRPSPMENNAADPFLPWKVNLFIDNTELEDFVPIVAEPINKLSDLAGAVDVASSYGTLYTDHMKLRSGRVAEANGGFLIINAQDLATVPLAWTILKRYIKSQAFTFESPAEFYGISSASHLSPMPMPLRLRVIVYGERWLLSLIAHYDSEFADLFRLQAEVLPFVERVGAQAASYARWMKWFTDERKCPSPSEEAVAVLIEHAGGLSGDQRRLSTDFSSLEAVIDEAALHAQRENAPKISGGHVRTALKERFWRSSFVYEEYQRMARDKTLLVSVSGGKIGQINGLYVTGGGGAYFGFPSRITSSVNVGKPGVVNIQRVAQMDGNIFRKADAIVQGLLKRLFAQDFGLALEVFFTFEQTYSVIDGDSASLAEFLVILSSIAEVPLRQGLAVTGSLNLHGEIQPIGGVTEKITGFFHVCRVQGNLDGEQGVVIPWQNTTNLALPDDVVEAVRSKLFHVIPVRTLEEGIEFFTGREAAEVYQRASARLKKFWEDAQRTRDVSLRKEEPAES